MRTTRQRLFEHSQCPNCNYRYEDACIVHTDCETCPMYFKPRPKVDQQSWIHHCHCLVPVTAEERRSGKCKFFKQKED